MLDEATPIPASFRNRRRVALDRSLAFVERVAAADVCYLGVKQTFHSHAVMHAHGTFETCRRARKLSAYR
ncbi:MAG TPA: hypothetical protein VK526_00165, partial [Bradyrhizobium sp.]|nr:hypothetical protein [Bradyrhizobium sp.]